ncbi:MAG: hypothetical protein ACRCXT_13925 [Paraclostridium sp.]
MNTNLNKLSYTSFPNVKLGHIYTASNFKVEFIKGKYLRFIIENPIGSLFVKSTKNTAVYLESNLYKNILNLNNSDNSDYVFVSDDRKKLTIDIYNENIKNLDDSLIIQFEAIENFNS